MRCSLNGSKNVLLRRRFLKVYATVFGLVFSCFFSTLPRWVSILTGQSTSTSMSAIVVQKTLYQVMFYNILLKANFGISVLHIPRNISFSFLHLFVLVKMAYMSPKRQFDNVCDFSVTFAGDPDKVFSKFMYLLIFSFLGYFHYISLLVIVSIFFVQLRLTLTWHNISLKSSSGGGFDENA